MKKYDMQAHEFSIEFDQKVKTLLAEKRRELEKEGNLVDYVKLDEIHEDMLGSCIKLYPKWNRSSEYSMDFSDFFSSSIYFVEYVSGTDWLTDMFFQAEGFIRKGIEDGKYGSNKSEAMAVLYFFQTIRHNLILLNILPDQAWNEKDNPFLCYWWTPSAKTRKK